MESTTHLTNYNGINTNQVSLISENANTTKHTYLNKQVTVPPKTTRNYLSRFFIKIGSLISRFAKFIYNGLISIKNTISSFFSNNPTITTEISKKSKIEERSYSENINNATDDNTKLTDETLAKEVISPVEDIETKNTDPVLVELTKKTNNFLESSKTLIDHLEVDNNETNVLGYGTCSIVKQGTFNDTENNTKIPVAIKIMDKSNKENTEKSFKKEVGNLLLLQEHPQVTKMLAAYEDPKTHSYVIVTELFGISVKQYILQILEDNKKLDLNVALYFIFTCIDFIKYCIQNNIYYQDMHTGNLLFSENKFKFCDFRDARYRSDFNGYIALCMIEKLHKTIISTLTNKKIGAFNEIGMYGEYCKNEKMTKEDREKLFDYYFTPKFKNCPHITDEFLDKTRVYFVEDRLACDCLKDLLQYSFSNLAEGLSIAKLKPPAFITYLDAWVDCIKNEFKYEEPKSMVAITIKKLSEKQAIEQQQLARRTQTRIKL